MGLGIFKRVRHGRWLPHVLLPGLCVGFALQKGSTGLSAPLALGEKCHKVPQGTRGWCISVSLCLLGGGPGCWQVLNFMLWFGCCSDTLFGRTPSWLRLGYFFIFRRSWPSLGGGAFSCVTVSAAVILPFVSVGASPVCCNSVSDCEDLLDGGC